MDNSFVCEFSPHGYVGRARDHQEQDKDQTFAFLSKEGTYCQTFVLFSLLLLHLWNCCQIFFELMIEAPDRRLKKTENLLFGELIQLQNNFLVAHFLLPIYYLLHDATEQFYNPEKLHFTSFFLCRNVTAASQYTHVHVVLLWCG